LGNYLKDVVYFSYPPQVKDPMLVLDPTYSWIVQ